MKREKDPHYLQDTVLPKDREHTTRFDAAREVGGERNLQEIRKNLEFDIAAMEVDSPGIAMVMDSIRQMLFGGDSMLENRAEALQKLRKELDNWTTDFSEFSWRAAAYRRATGEVYGGDVDHDQWRDFLRREIQGNVSRERRAMHAANYRQLFGGVFWTDKERDDMLEALRRELSLEGLVERAAYILADIRVLKAHDLKFTPGKGIEIIDDPPAEFEKKTEPIPEERKF